MNSMRLGRECQLKESAFPYRFVSSWDSDFLVLQIYDSIGAP